MDECNDPTEVLRMARIAVKEANNRALRMQTQTTQQLVQRVKDLKYWSGEIDRYYKISLNYLNFLENYKI